MKHDTATEKIQEMAALYALGALCQHETLAFKEHLSEGCGVCDRENTSFENVVTVLAAETAGAAPSAHVRELLAARIRNEPQGAAASPDRPVTQFRERREAMAQRRGMFSGAALPWALAASLVIAFGLAYLWWDSDRTAILNEASSQISAALSDRDKLKRELGQQKARSDELATINDVLSTPGSKMIALAGQPAAPSASGHIYWDVKSNRWVVTADLPPAPAGRVYQLWFVTPAAKISAGLIKSDQAGHGFVVVPFPSNLGHLAAAAITLEPAGGSTQPTMPIYALAAAS